MPEIKRYKVRIYDSEFEIRAYNVDEAKDIAADNYLRMNGQKRGNKQTGTDKKELKAVADIIQIYY